MALTTCDLCHGAKEIPYYGGGSMLKKAPDKYIRCPICHGTGEVKVRSKEEPVGEQLGLPGMGVK